MREEQGQAAQVQSSAKLVFERMIQAANNHNLDAMVACFAPHFRSEQPFDPERNFTGQAGVRKNWSFFFSKMPDFHAEVQRLVVEEETVWAEMTYSGTQADGTKHVTQGVTISGMQAGQIAWSKLYIVTSAEP